MGQKANPLSLRPILYPALSINSSVESFLFLKVLSSFLRKKGFYLNSYKLNITDQGIYFFLDVIASRRNFVYNRKFRRILKKYSSKGGKKKRNESIRNLMKNLLVFYKKSYCILKFKRIDLGIVSEELNRVWYKFKKITSYTWRKNPYMIDLFYIGVCFLQKRASVVLLNACLSLFFRRLSKRQHRRFFYFLKKYLQMIYKLDKKVYKYIQGFKILISGKIGGKTRAKSVFFVVGKIPTQSFRSCVDYSSIPSYTNMGSFGIKCWFAYHSKTIKYEFST